MYILENVFIETLFFRDFCTYFYEEVGSDGELWYNVKAFPFATIRGPLTVTALME